MISPNDFSIPYVDGEIPPIGWKRVTVCGVDSWVDPTKIGYREVPLSTLTESQEARIEKLWGGPLSETYFGKMTLEKFRKRWCYF